MTDDRYADLSPSADLLLPCHPARELARFRAVFQARIQWRSQWIRVFRGLRSNCAHICGFDFWMDRRQVGAGNGIHRALDLADSGGCARLGDLVNFQCTRSVVTRLSVRLRR